MLLLLLLLLLFLHILLILLGASRGAEMPAEDAVENYWNLAPYSYVTLMRQCYCSLPLQTRASPRIACLIVFVTEFTETTSRSERSEGSSGNCLKMVYVCK